MLENLIQPVALAGNVLLLVALLLRSRKYPWLLAVYAINCAFCASEMYQFWGIAEPLDWWKSYDAYTYLPCEMAMAIVLSFAVSRYDQYNLIASSVLYWLICGVWIYEYASLDHSGVSHSFSIAVCHWRLFAEACVDVTFALILYAEICGDFRRRKRWQKTSKSGNMTPQPIHGQSSGMMGT